MTLLKMSIYGAVIILAIVLIRALTLHKLPKKIFVILWSIALLRLLIPFEISSSYSIYSLLPNQQTETEQNVPQGKTSSFHRKSSSFPFHRFPICHPWQEPNYRRHQPTPLPLQEAPPSGSFSRFFGPSAPHFVPCIFACPI